MVLVVVLDDGDGQDGEVREGEKVVEGVTGRHGQQGGGGGPPNPINHHKLHFGGASRTPVAEGGGALCRARRSISPHEKKRPLGGGGLRAPA